AAILSEDDVLTRMDLRLRHVPAEVDGDDQPDNALGIADGRGRQEGAEAFSFASPFREVGGERPEAVIGVARTDRRAPRVRVVLSDPDLARLESVRGHL